MINFKVGTAIQLKDAGENTYKIINIVDKYYELEAIDFYYPENLGDGININGLGQTAWISSFMSYLFKIV